MALQHTFTPDFPKDPDSCIAQVLQEEKEGGGGERLMIEPEQDNPAERVGLRLFTYQSPLPPPSPDLRGRFADIWRVSLARVNFDPIPEATGAC